MYCKINGNKIAALGKRTQSLQSACKSTAVRPATVTVSAAAEPIVVDIPRPAAQATTQPAVNREGYWMPFTDNKHFKQNPTKILAGAKGVNFFLRDGTPILDGMSGLWCVNAGHCNPKIVEAIQKQAANMDFAPSFMTGHDLPFKFADQILKMLPCGKFSQVFFTMCGSTAVDTSLKMALQYHRSRGNGSKVRFIGRERGYHGVGFGGISVGGITPNRKAFGGNMLPFTDHMPHTHSLKDMAYSKGLPTWGAHLADELENLLLHHDPSNVAAVIVEPVAGSTGVLPPPVGYLKRLREICDKHDVLLIFDEVITAFGRVGDTFATEKFGVAPDMITCAKGLTNAAVPAGAVITQKHIFESIQNAVHPAGSSSSQIEFFHGYTYSGHPLAMAAGIATQDFFREEEIFQRSDSLAPYWEEAIHSLKGLPHVIDIRNVGLMGAVELAAIPGAPTKRAADVFDRAFEHGVLLRATGSTIACSPTLISEKKHLDQIVDTLKKAILESAEKLEV